MAALRRSVPAILLAVLLAASCSGQESGQESQQESERGSGQESGAAEVEPLPVDDGEVTETGSELAFGDVAVIHGVSGEVEGTYAVRVELEQGKPADLDDVDVDEDVEGLVPYYVRYTFQKVESDHDSFRQTVTPVYFDARLANGDRVSPSDVPEDWATCPNVALAPAEFEDDEPWATCRTHLVPEGAKLSRVAYVGPDDDSKDGYREQPIVWAG